MKIPQEIQSITEKLRNAGFEAYIVGGSVRDFLMKKTPKDWDMTTDAVPEEIQKIFPHSFYNNNFGTVTVINEETAEESLKTVEITTYRTETEYTDRRHPDKVKFTPSLSEDLKRRDFTINAMALREKDEKQEVVDLFNGKDDLDKKIIRAAGNPDERFSEDALRMLRAIRFAVQLDFKIEEATFGSIKKNASLIENISKERIRDEFQKMILSNNPARSIELLQESGILKFVIPELEEGIGMTQNRHHIYTIYEHLIRTLRECPSKKLEVRLAALFHDIAKPQTKAGEGQDSTFYNHDFVGAKVTGKILRRLKFSNKTIENTSLLVKNHMFYYNTGEVSEAGVRRLIKRVGKENLKDLMDLRIADRLGSGTPKAKPYKLRHLEYLIEKVSKDPISPKMLKINGEDIMNLLDIQPGPKVGAILKVLLAEIIEDTDKNDREHLEDRVRELYELSLEDIKKSEKIIEEKKEEEDLKDKNKFWVK
ncbi:MAG: HD domain-containing protein [Candidatus Pacebacteria bacterium]|nr:HD domain-containing protein [Candidatus Paceibacterota bacterium]